MTTNDSSYKKLFEHLGPLTFARFLRASRTTSGITQVDLAKKTKSTKSMICDIEKGRQLVSLELAIKLARACGTSEPLAVKCALEDQIRKAKLKYTIEIRKAS